MVSLQLCIAEVRITNENSFVHTERNGNVDVSLDSHYHYILEYVQSLGL